MQLATPELNIAANRLAQKWLTDIRGQLESLPRATQEGCWKVILDRCQLRRTAKFTPVAREQMVTSIEERIRKLHEKYATRWRWPTFYAEFSQDCGIAVIPPTDDTAGRFASAIQRLIDYDRYNLPQLLKLKEKIVDAVLIFHGHRRATLTAVAALEGAAIADEWISKMEAEIVDVELKGRERFWEKVALSAKEWDD